MQNHTPLLKAVEDFLSQSGMGASYFGKVAVGNSELVKRLRAGGRVLVDTDRDVRAFIAEYSPSSEAPSSAVASVEGSLPTNKRLAPKDEFQGEASS